METKRQWLFDKIHHPQKYADLPHAPGKEVVNGESALYLGREYRIEIEETESGRVEFNRRFFVPKLQQKRRREVLREWYFDRAREKVLPRVQQCAVSAVTQSAPPDGHLIGFKVHHFRR